MSVPYPINYSFPGAETPWGSVPAASPGPWEMDNATEANTIANIIGDEIAGLRNEANELADQAAEFINACRDFTADVPGIVYTQPGYQRTQFNGLTVGTLAAAITPPTVTVATPALGESDVPTFEQSLAPPAPPSLEVTFPSEPDPVVPGALTGAPLVQDISVPTAPDVTITAQAVPEVPEMPPAPSVPAGPSMVSPASLPATAIPTPDFAARIAELERIAGTRATVKTYSSVVPSIFVAVGGVLSQGTAPAREQYLAVSLGAQQEATRRTAAGYSRRGLSDPTGPTLQAIEAQAALDAKQSAVATDLLWVDDTRRTRFSVLTSAHAQAMELSKLLTDLEFSTLTTYAEGQLALIAATTVAYDGAVAALEAGAANKSAEFAREESRGTDYRMYIEGVKSASQQNRLTHKVFAAQERAKQVAVTAAKSKLQGEQAKVDTFEAENQAAAAKAEALEARLIEYRARVAAWTGRLASAGAIWARYSAKMDGVSARNRAAAAETELGSLENRATVAAAQSGAANLIADLARYSLGVIRRRGELQHVQTQNRAAGDTASNAAAAYRRTVLGAEVAPIAAGPELDGRQAEYGAASRYFARAAEMAGRAAEMTQAANIELAKAYATAQEAAGRAVAAIEAGRYGQLKASAALSAEGSLGAAGGGSRTLSNDYEWQVRESWGATETIETKG